MSDTDRSDSCDFGDNGDRDDDSTYSYIRGDGVYGYIRGFCALCSRKVRHLDGTLDVIYCDRCLPELFPFNSIVNDREFVEALNGFRINQRHLDKAAGLKFNPLDETIKDTLVDLDRTLGGCSYYDEEKFCKMRQDFLSSTISLRRGL